MPDPLINQTLGDYTILELLGRGGMARVYRGYDRRLDRFAAIKVIDADPLLGSQEEYQNRFTREARAIAHLQHPNIVGIYQFGQQGGVYFMAMQFVEGQDLRHVLKAYHDLGQHMPHAEVFHIIRDIGGALDHAHSQGVIHRDIKPSNIMVTPQGRAILTDFGLALHVPEGSLGDTFGSAHYISPEQAVSSHQARPQSDLYSLGVVLYEMLTGQVPFDDPSVMAVALKHLHEPPPPPREINPALAPAVEVVLLRLLEKQPEARYPDAQTMIAALERALNLPVEDDDNTVQLERAALDFGDSVATAGRVSVEDMAAAPEPTLVATDTGPPQPTGPLGAHDARTGGLPLARIAAGALLVIALIVTGALLLGRNAGGAAPPASETPLPAMASPATPTAIEVASTAAPSPTAPEPTVTVVEAVAAAPTATATHTPLEPSPEPPTALPTESATSAPAATTIPTTAAPATTAPTPTVQAAAPTPAPRPDADVVLLYDDRALLLINLSERHLNVARLVFQRQDPAGGPPIAFSADDWIGGSAPPYALPPGECFQVWRDDLGILAPDMPFDTDRCTRRAAWRIVSPLRWFWLGDAPGMTFDVLQFGQVIAVCDVARPRQAASRCDIVLP